VTGFGGGPEALLLLLLVLEGQAQQVQCGVGWVLADGEGVWEYSREALFVAMVVLVIGQCWQHLSMHGVFSVLEFHCAVGGATLPVVQANWGAALLTQARVLHDDLIY
jgi:hypothetical protein